MPGDLALSCIYFNKIVAVMIPVIVFRFSIHQEGANMHKLTGFIVGWSVITNCTVFYSSNFFFGPFYIFVSVAAPV